jgi:predicted RND superfamily exporter protein
MQFRFEGDMKEPETLAKIEKLQNKMEENQKVTTSMSIADAIKQMHRTVMDDDPDYETIPDTRGKVNNLFTLYAMSGDPDDFSSLVDYEYSSGLMTTFMRNMTSSLIIEYVESTHDFIADSLEATDKITVTGMLVVFRDLITLIIRSSAISISISIVLIALIAGFFFKRILWGLLAVVPLMSAVILNFGFMGIFGVDLNHITAILSSIIIGVGVDFAIHYISQYRRLVKQKVSVDVLSREVVDDVGYPIILDALSNMAFGALLFSQFLPIQHMGGLMVFGMISTSVGTLTILATTAELLKHKLIKL